MLSGVSAFSAWLKPAGVHSWTPAYARLTPSGSEVSRHA